MRYKVPQDVQREDQILWFITLRQLIMLLIGGGVSYVLFVQLNKIYVLSDIQQALIWLPLVFMAAFAFLKIKHIPLPQFCLLIIEYVLFRPARRWWVAGGGNPFWSMTSNYTLASQKKSKSKGAKEKKHSADDIHDLARILDRSHTAHPATS